ncbi:uncharacterized protein LAESUDRAFT_227240 [Laetiporus sulphureus 93-53]|uniref:Uncharacterized protein n=1 Tax=Laetiporus sulphureus 93-53 TaxID=1314785 RepID=A0A165DPZ4_9APHY|nr:uncharacterized protein LAESUDRAFT_227240 [Laetiporus sulphureus 93-53]KZT05369.1 hypothetical protein LAESUDRAFT_227240 [Laetiporus sulphureus 93-53]
MSNHDPELAVDGKTEASVGRRLEEDELRQIVQECEILDEVALRELEREDLETLAHAFGYSTNVESEAIIKQLLLDSPGGVLIRPSTETTGEHDRLAPVAFEIPEKLLEEGIVLDEAALHEIDRSELEAVAQEYGHRTDRESEEIIRQLLLEFPDGVNQAILRVH